VSPWQDMDIEIAWWVEHQGYAQVLDALISVCQYWATSEEGPPIEGPAALWAKREHALRQTQRESER
jgi:hypothetical protein